MNINRFDPLKKKRLQILDKDGNVMDEKLEPKLSESLLLDMYKAMVRGRIADIKAIQFQRQGRMLTFVPNQGQEAAQIGATAALKKTDWLVPSFREFNAMLYHGATLEQAYLYWYGNEFGSKFDDGVNILPVNITIGAQISHAAGIAYGSKYQGKDEIVLAFIGDGGTSHGEFHEGINFAGVFELPVVIVIQNNGWAISTPTVKATKAKTLAQKAIGYGIPGIQVDGNDLLAMYVATSDAVKRARERKGPTLIEAITYRMGSHTTSDDPTIYRKDEEVKKWEQKDPIKRFKAYLINKGLWTEKKDENLQAKYNQEVIDTFKQVEQSKVELEDIFNYNYESLTPRQQEQLDEYKNYIAGRDE